MGKPFTMMVTLTIDPDRMPEYLAALHDVLVPARAERTNAFLYAHTTEKIGTVVLFERWLDSEAYLNQVLPSDHYRRYLDLTEALYVAPREVTFLTPIEWADEGC